MIFPFAADLPSLKLRQGKVAGKGKPLSPAYQRRDGMSPGGKNFNA
jgi:hypothetical protein